MNYIYFNSSGRLKDKNLSEFIQTSHLVDKIYLFYDADTELVTSYSATLAFKRADGYVIGEIECLREAATVLNPYTNTLMPAFSLLIGSDILAVSGQLKITARYYTSTVINAEGLIKETCKAMGLVTTNVTDAVSGDIKSTVVANLNSRIDKLEARILALESGT